MRTAAEWVWGARRGAGSSQRELAKRSGVPQPTIAKIERGHQIPRVDTLMRILDACDFELRLGPRRGKDVDVSLIDHWLSLSSKERAEGTADYGRAAEVLQRARKVG